jgi:uncharacterized protein YjbJ (UPF0337 family)
MPGGPPPQTPDKEQSAMDSNRIEGIGHQIKGSLKEQFGKLIGDAKLRADGAAERAVGDAQNIPGGPLIPGIDTDRITGVAHQIKGAGEKAWGRLVGDHGLMLDGTAEISAGKAQNAAGSARDEARQAELAADAARHADAMQHDGVAHDDGQVRDNLAPDNLKHHASEL